MKYYTYLTDAGQTVYFPAASDVLANEYVAEEFFNEPGILLGSDQPPIGWIHNLDGTQEPIQ